MINSDAAVMFECLPEVVPERELAAYTRMQRPKRVGVAESKHCPIAVARLRLKECIVNPRCRFMAIDVFWNDVEIAANDGRCVALEPELHLLFESVHPGELIVELRCAHGVAVWQVDVHDADVLDHHFEKASVTVRLVPEQGRADNLYWTAREDGDAVIGLLRHESRIVTQLFEER